MNTYLVRISQLVVMVLFFGCIGAQSIRGQEKRTTCESRNGNYNYCRADTDNNVRLVRKISFVNCIEGSSWGYDRRGIWVDRGCRAEFAYGNSGGSKTGAIVAGSLIGGAILAGVLASRSRDENKYNDSSSVYTFGYNKGRSDAVGNKSSDYGRYRGKYNSSFESDFIRGYNDGYRNNSGSNSDYNYGGNASQKEAYNAGYQRGIDDANDNRRSDYQRYRNQYSYQTETSFSNGYNDGYRNNTLSYDNRSYNSDTVPKWLVGTFRGYAQGSRTYTEMTIYADGRIWLRSQNGTGSSSGKFENGMLHFDWGTFRPDRSGNGFFSRSTMGSESIYYERTY